MKSKKYKLFSCMIIGALISSCAVSRPGQPYTPSSSNPSRNDITDVQASSTLNNLYALLLSPTNDQISLLDLADNRVKLSVKTGRNPQFLAVSPNKSHILVVNQLDGTISTFFREDNYRIRDLGTIGSSGTPTDITFNSTGTEAYVADQTLGRITVLEILNRDRPKVKKIISVKTDNDAAGIASPFKVAVSQDNNNLYAIDKNNGRVYTFNRQNNEFVQNLTINLSGQTRSTPEEILFDKDKLYITDSNNSTLITVDTKTNAVINTLGLTNQDFRENLIPTRMAINSNAGKLYVVNNGTSSIAVVNINNNTLTKHISLATNTVSDAGGPSDISVSDNGNTIYVTNTVGRNLSIISGTQDILLRNIGTSASAGALVPLSAIKII